MRVLLSGGLRFQGDTVIRLLEHMYKNGFEFASPEPGGEGVYKNLFQSLRSLYVSIGPEPTGCRFAADGSRNRSASDHPVGGN